MAKPALYKRPDFDYSHRIGTNDVYSPSHELICTAVDDETAASIALTLSKYTEYDADSRELLDKIEEQNIDLDELEKIIEAKKLLEKEDLDFTDVEDLIETKKEYDELLDIKPDNVERIKECSEKVHEVLDDISMGLLSDKEIVLKLNALIDELNICTLTEKKIKQLQEKTKK